ncbi:MAG: TrbG/VirB9 family P-type conjugative transfer protein, partial [Steroidobacteraceae bacterium]
GAHLMKARSFYRALPAIGLACLLAASLCAQAEMMPLPGRVDARIRSARYSPDQVYRLQGYVGFEIDIQFAPGEHFVGLGAGDIEGLAFAAQGNHLFLKPKAAKVDTNLTVLTTRHAYHFEYSATRERPRSDGLGVIYALRFSYPPVPASPAALRAARAAKAAAAQAARINAALKAAPSPRPRNYNYWYCGSEAIRPIAASDDGVQTRLTFRANAQLPAIFVKNADGSESLLNFTVDGGDVVIFRVARRFILRRGKLAGCIVNKGFSGAGVRLPTGTLSPAVERVTKGETP